ncbi:Pyruvate dehydrogenase E1 component subunit beta-3, chloroplastic [Morella rubra]|uniref:Pyruvate dehydrogenase E1 component subunit beta-3, chloroplastic n=1 Tax=Morella rubra TaxID=262757 RepID=A0A6A1WFD4_9ROSI|nr:Pyruvate dehydrogenase E1 component subunit beta-3, chloroplastic [Morella rubra]
MATVFQGVGAATALSASRSVDSRKFHLPSGRSLSERKSSFLVVRSEGRVVPGTYARGRRAEQLITNAVATKADSSAASTTSKPGYDSLL